MKFILRIFCAVIFFSFIFPDNSYANINRKTVEKAWKKISVAAEFEKIPVNYENDDDPNAYVAYDDEGNYTLHVTKGLMKILNSEEEIAGILGHELGHIELGHYHNFALNDTVNTIMKTNLERNDELAQAVGNIDMELRESKFSREQETQADNYGVKILVKAGYNSWGLYNAMKKFDINGYETEKNGFNSHPASKERLKNLANEARRYNKEYTNDTRIKNDDEKKLNELANILMGN